jgi:inositol-hexakisphosphate/diphosphoinositol-pentakisphosphate 1-kinase
MVLRHADRTPKQKVKVSLSHPAIMTLFTSPKKEVKMKSDSGQERLKALLAIVQGIVTGRDYSCIHDKYPENKLRLVVHVLTELFSGTKVQLKPTATSDDGLSVTRALLVCKWGGMITRAGVQQANRLGVWLRQHLSGCNGVTNIDNYLRNMQVWSNNERRVKRVCCYCTHQVLQAAHASA